ncbi:hypothetical protein [Polyangium jinanense]|uniref:Uncharacterized protein n=1 Tax=Polyangium jinanense TaxID=2829994 RepID=A0A9X3X1C9_9BACT|nr:hypothetical protein [Polyangium jinanense]MDC3954100.1 hypothetical protein [Polyangium jinanense]MDC3981944.1 hypothetical protein [Polyangium jinanense]
MMKILHHVLDVAGRDGLAEKKAAQEIAVFEVKAPEEGGRRRKVCRLVRRGRTHDPPGMERGALEWEP